MPVLETVHDEVEEIEDRVLTKPMTRADIERLYMLRRDLLRVRGVVGPLVDVCGRLSTANLPQIRTAMQPMFRDVTDHIRTVQEKIDSCSPSPSRRAYWSARARRRQSPSGSRPGPQSSPCRPPSPASTA